MTGQELVAATGRTMEDLAMWWAQNHDLPTPKKAALLGVSDKVVHQLAMYGQFRQVVSEYVALAEVTPQTEREILQRMKAVVDNPKSTAFEVEAAARFLQRQAGLYRGDKRQVDHTGGIRVEFILDRPEDFGYNPPDPLAGVEGIQDASFTVEGEGEDEAHYTPAGVLEDGR